MNSMKISAFALTGLLCLAGPAVAKDDKIIYLDGQQKSPCRVSQEKFAEVKYRYKRQSMTDSGDKILEIDGWETNGHTSEEIIRKLRAAPRPRSS